MKQITILLFLSITASLLFAGEPTIIPKTGRACPYGYISDGSYCRPSSNAKEAIVKIGRQCPRGFVSNRNYCRRISAKPSSVIPKSGKNCPRGYVSDGDYCRTLD